MRPPVEVPHARGSPLEQRCARLGSVQTEYGLISSSLVVLNIGGVPLTFSSCTWWVNNQFVDDTGADTLGKQSNSYDAIVECSAAPTLSTAPYDLFKVGRNSSYVFITAYSFGAFLLIEMRERAHLCHGRTFRSASTIFLARYGRRV